MIEHFRQKSINGSLLVYPNPGANELHLDFSTLEQDWMELRVSDLQGKPVLWLQNIGVLDQSKQVINISTWLSGLYFVVVKGEKGVFTQKFVKL